MRWNFSVVAQSAKSRARVGKIETPHGAVDTPGFVPVATNAAVKAVDVVTADELGCQLMFCNTYHLMLQPGAELVHDMGGLHKFMNRKGPLITDSGGFQVMSMMAGSLDLDENVGLKGTHNRNKESKILNISETGVLFRSYRDGRTIELTPESSVDAQKLFGADILVPLDYLLPYSASRKLEEKAFEITLRWERRSWERHQENTKDQVMYSVVHGGTDQNLRRKSVNELAAMGFDGHAIGGSLGKNREDMLQILKFTLPLLPEDAPNHILGIGDLASIEAAVPLGADTFDSSYPTRLARHGNALQELGHPHRNLKRKTANERDEGPVLPGCHCYCCSNYSAAYIHHLFRAFESSGEYLLSVHNLHTMTKHFAQMRQDILDGKL